MTNAEKFRKHFGIYATELWAMTEKDFLEWLNANAPDLNAEDAISRQAAIDALKEHRALYCDNTPDTFSKLSYAEKSRVDELDTAIATLVNLPSAQPEIIRCNECRYANECHKSVQYTRNEPNTVTIGYSQIEWCSKGERRTDA